MLKNITRVILLSLLVFTVACGQTDETNKMDPNQLTIYTSIYPIQYIAKYITGDDALVKTVYPPGVDAHSYEPTTKEILDIAKGDAFIYLGAGMEGFAPTAAAALKSHDVLFVELGLHEHLFNQHEDTHDGHDHGGIDPHIWLDPLRMIEMAAIIKDALITLTPDLATIYEANFAALTTELKELDTAYTNTLAGKTQKDIIVAHAAYGYWEERYGIKQLAISGLMAGNEPSQKELANIVKQAKAKKINYVIFEQTGLDRVSTIIQEHIGAEALHIHNLEVLTETDIKNGADYLSLMYTNLDVLDQATK